MKVKEIYHKKTKEFFDKIGLEKTSSDFTSIVMERIQAVPGIEKSKILPGLPYFLMAIFFTAGILILPFNNYIMDFINDLVNKVLNIDYTIIYNIIVNITDTIMYYAVSSTALILFTLIVISLFVLISVTYSDYRYDTSRIQIS